jgi:DNA invertase Pin-like site-specific DNA recombinase
LTDTNEVEDVMTFQALTVATSACPGRATPCEAPDLAGEPSGRVGAAGPDNVSKFLSPTRSSSRDFISGKISKRISKGTRLSADGTRLLVAYYRVSTQKQGRSGLGLEAQRDAVERFAAAHGLVVEQEYTEVETGKGADALEQRPELARALAHAKRLNCKIVVAKLDRLSRDVHFISGLMSQRVPFVVTELGPDVDPFMLHIYAAVAQKEAALISQRTRAAMRAAKRRGVRLGNPDMDAMQAKGREAKVQAADRFARAVSGTIEGIRGRGITSLRAIAAELNLMKVATASGATWSAQTVKNVLARIEEAK